MAFTMCLSIYLCVWICVHCSLTNFRIKWWLETFCLYSVFVSDKRLKTLVFGQKLCEITTVWHNFLQGGQLHILAPVIALVVFRNAKISTNYTILPSVRPLTCPLWQLARWVPNPLQSQGQHDFKNVLAAYLNKKNQTFFSTELRKGDSTQFHTKDQIWAI